MKIVVLFGGISTERNVSIAGGKAVVEALRGKGHEVIPVDPAFGDDAVAKSEEILADITKFNSLDELKSFSQRDIINCINSDIFDGVDVAFNVMHGKYGEDGTIQALLELRGIPYTGSGVKASSASMDKVFTKLVLSSVGVPNPAWGLATADEADDYDHLKEIRDMFGNDIVIKPVDQGSTIGLTIIHGGNLDDIAHGIKLACEYSRTALIERYIPGYEITATVIGGEAYPLVEIVPQSGLYDYDSKYTKGTTEYICPAEIDEGIAEFTQNLAVTAYNAMGCDGFARIDFRIDEDGQPFCLEVNTIPGFTALSLVPMAAKETGIEFPELCEMIIDLALNNKEGI